MSYIVDFFQAIADIITSIVEFIIDFFTGLADFFIKIPEYTEVVESYIDIVPDSMKSFIVMVLAACLIFVIIGRRGV